MLTLNFKGLFLWLALMGTAVHCLSNEPSDQGPRIINIMSAFWAFESAARTSMPQADRSALFRRFVLDPYRDLYGLAEFRNDIDAEAIKAYLAKVQPYLPEMRKLSEQVEREVGPAETRFIGAFPGFKAEVTIVYMPSGQ